MSSTVKSPNEKGKGFLWAVVGIIVIAVVVVGYIVINGKNTKREAMIDTVAFTTSWEGDKITLKGEQATDDTPVADVYEDFSCPHCADLALEDRQAMREAVDNGELVVNIRPLVFMDNTNRDAEMSDEEKDGNSHRALAAVLGRTRRAATTAFLTRGVVLALVWLRLGSVDVALAEAGLGTAVLAAVLVWVAVRTPAPDGAAPAPTGRAGRAALAAVTGAVAVLLPGRVTVL